MQIASKSLFALCLLSSTVWAVESTTPTPATTVATSPAVSATVTPTKPVSTAVHPNTATITTKPLTAEQIAKAKQQQDVKIKAQIQDQANRLKQLEHANLEALAQNQELQLKNDNLTVQVQVLQSERSAQMFLYGAMTLAAGVILGFLIASYIYTKRRRQW